MKMTRTQAAHIRTHLNVTLYVHFTLCLSFASYPWSIS